MINGRWALQLPDHRADRPEWPWWEATRLAAMRHHISARDVVYDVGAEEGDFPALYSSWGAEVVMAEPNARVWPNIYAIWQANDLRPPLYTWPGFLGDQVAGPEPAWASDGSTPGNWPASALGEVISDHGFCQLGERPDIPMTTIDQLVLEEGEQPPTVITMDVEGSEFHVLNGAAEVIESLRPKVFVSIHPEFMAHHYGITDGVKLIRDLMSAHRYDEKFLCIDHEHHWMFLPR